MGKPSLAQLVIAAVALAPGILFAACEPWSREAAENRDLTVGSVQLTINDVFDENLAEENRGIHQRVNRLHNKSKRKLIRAQLLFSQGEPFDIEALEETERNLRANRYLRTAAVTPKQICEGEVDILVETDDNWSLVPNYTFARAGGVNTFAFKLAELNLLGLGKGLEIEFGKTTERNQQVLRYFDPMLFGSQTQFSTQLQNNTDGQVQVVEFSQPFTSLDKRHSWRVRAGNTEFTQNIYAATLTVDQVAVDREFASIEYGLSKGKQLVGKDSDGRNIHRIVRWQAGWQYERTRQGATANFPDSTPVAERLYSYPFAQMTFLRPEYLKQTNLQLMESVEDISIGHRLRTRIGWASEKLGSTDDAAVFELAYSKGWHPSEKILGLFNTRTSGFAGGDGVENGVTSATVEGFYFASLKKRFFASANLTYGTRLFEHNQIVIGGNTGLRGYPLRIQTGAKRARFTVEQRYFLDWYPLRLARVGMAAFADIGSAWENGEDPDWLKDVGVGFRIVNTRQADAKVMHIDLAFPIDGRDQVDGFQFVVSAKTQF